MDKETENTKKSQKPSFIWDSEKKRPNIIFLVILISITVSLIVWSLFTTFIYIHEIRVVVEYDGGFNVNVIYEGSRFGGGGVGNEEFVYRVSEGVEIEVQASRAGSGSGPLTVLIYDNGNLVVSNTSMRQFQPINLRYIVGE